MIEKKIHYCWFGRGEKDRTILECIKSWKEILVGFEFIEWNEDNSSYDTNFAINAFKSKKWAFLSDYIRLKALYEYGGIYLDTDMFLVKSLDPLLSHNCFFGLQADGQINGSIIGCVKGDPFIGLCLMKYKELTFNQHRLMSLAIPRLITEVYGTYAQKDAISVYPPSYFYPYSFEDSLKKVDFRKSVKPESFAVHLWNASWFSDKERAGFAFEEGKYMKMIIYSLRYLVSKPSVFLHLPSILLRVLRGKGWI